MKKDIKRLNRIEKKFIARFNKLGNKYWFYKFYKNNPGFNINNTDPKKLRLIIGLGRSGTSWVGKMLSTSSTPLRYFNEILHHLKPELSLKDAFNHTEIRYYSSLRNNHRLYFTYKLLTCPQYNWNKLGIEKKLLRNDKNFKYCLIKEVHSLQVSHAIINYFKIPVIIILRNPIYIVDSLYDAHKTFNPYMKNEDRQLIKFKGLLNDYFPEKKEIIIKKFNDLNKNKKNKLKRILIIAVISKYLEQMAKNYDKVYLVKYEDICQSPELYFKKMANHLNLEWNNKNSKKLLKTTNKLNEQYNKYSIYRDTQAQLNKPFKNLNKNIIIEANVMLDECGLIYN